MYKPVVLVILDGFGRGPENAANAIFAAIKPNFDLIEKNYPLTNLQASGIAAGLPWGENGNSEVGHLNLGSGRIVYQYLPRIVFAIRDGSFFKNEALLGLKRHAEKSGGAVHFMGILSSGSVHSYIDHFYALLDFAKSENLKKVFIHAFTDGRDAPPKEAGDFLVKVQNKIGREYPFARIATVIGRSYAMDRDNNWEKTEKTYRLLAEMKGDVFDGVENAVNAAYQKNLTDESVPPSVIKNADGSLPTPVKSGDAVLFFNFREDSARQLTESFTLENFSGFPRTKIDDLYFAAMTRYEENLPIKVLFEPTEIKNPLAAVLAEHKKTQFHIAETEKYAHVTYFFNGGVENPFPGQRQLLVKSEEDYNYAKNPAMAAPEITQKIIEAADSGEFDFIVANYANADMVGHTGNFNAVVKAVEVLDKEIGRLMNAVFEKRGVLIITADHGNADEKINLISGTPWTEHSGNPVPFYLIAEDFKKPKTPEEVEREKMRVDGLLADVAPTILELMGIGQPAEMTGKSLLKLLEIKPQSR